MKKLISLLAALAVVSTCTMSAFAFSVDADNDATTDNNTAMTVTTVESPTKYEADATTGNYTVDASVVGTQDQTTILAVKGDVVRLGSIEYIDQSATQSFSFALRNELAAGETVNVLVGGSNGTVYNTGYMQGASESQEPTDVEYKGVVTNVPTQSFIDDELSVYYPDIFGSTDGLEDYIAEYTTIAYLVATDAVEEFVACYESGEGTFTYIDKATAAFDSGEYVFKNIEDGIYALIIARPSALPYMTYVTVADGKWDAPEEVTLKLGDLKGSVDWIIEPSDVATMVGAISEIGQDQFDPAFDFLSDCLIDPSDVAEIVANISDITIYNTTLINELFN